MDASVELPECLSIILCDVIYRDEETKNLIIVGTFNRVRPSGPFPFQMHRMTVLFTLTGGRGQYDVSLSVEHELTGEPLIEMRGPMALSDPLAIADFHVVLEGVPFPQMGKYWIVLKANDTILRQRPFHVEAPIAFTEETEHTDV